VFTRPLVRSLAVAAVLTFALTACGDAFHRPAAIVHGVNIDDHTVEATLPVSRVLTALLRQSCGTTAPGEPFRGPCLRYTVGFLIERQIVRAYAQAHHLRVRPFEVRRSVAAIQQRFGPDQVRQILGQFGLSESGFEGLIREQLLVGRVQQAVATAAVGEQALRAAYRRERARFTLVHAAHIQLATQQDAERVAAQVTPENFAALAKKYSTEQATSGKGGDLGTVPIGRLPADFAKATLALQPGQVSAPIQTISGWEIIKLISLRTAPYRSVRSTLQSELYGPAIQRWYRGQFQDGVEVNPRYGRIDPSTGQVVPLNSTATALPSPSPSGP
jgi:hypothetical protein